MPWVLLLRVLRNRAKSVNGELLPKRLHMGHTRTGRGSIHRAVCRLQLAAA